VGDLYFPKDHRGRTCVKGCVCFLGRVGNKDEFYFPNTISLSPEVKFH
jgi:hypothetical protein